MEDIEELVQDFDQQAKLFHQAAQRRSSEQCQQTLQKLQQIERKIQACAGQLSATQRQKIDALVRQKSSELRQMGELAKQQGSPAQLSSDQGVASFQKMQIANQYNQDSMRNAHEAAETGQAIVTQLVAQNQQMRGISGTIMHIDQNTAKSQQLIAEMHRKEVRVNIILYLIVAVFVLLDCLAFWLFHHNVKPAK